MGVEGPAGLRVTPTSFQSIPLSVRTTFEGMAPNDDNEFRLLLTGARAGDREAWNAIFERLASREQEGRQLHAIARKLLPQSDRARDIVDSLDLMQSALRSGWLDASQFRGESEGEFFRWMRTILRRKIGRAVRRKRPQIGFDAADDVVPDEGGETGARDPLAALVKSELRAKLKDALAQLPDDQRRVLELRIAGKNSPEIGRELGISAEAVRMREMRAARRLRELLT